MTDKKKPDDLDPATITISIDLTKCTFQVVAKNTNWTWQAGQVLFGFDFGSFTVAEQLTL